MEHKAVKKAKKGLFSIVFGRTALILMLVLIQLIVLVGVATILNDYAVYVYGGFTVLAAVIVIYIINERGNPAFNMTWVLLILIFPAFGCLFYIWVKSQLGTRYIGKRLCMLRLDTAKYMQQEPRVIEALRESKPANANLAHYMQYQLNFPTYRNTQVQYFACGEEKFPVLLEELKKAEKFIFLEYFIVEEGYMWGSVLEILKEKAAAGVEVRFMYDGMCSISLLPPDYPKKIRRFGIQCKMFSPIRPVLSTTQNNRDHRKICVIDGKTGFTGGINLGDEYINRKERFGYWKDTAVMIKGDAVQSLTMLFLQMWNAFALEKDKLDYEKFCLEDVRPLAKEERGIVLPYSDHPLDSEFVGESVYINLINSAQKYIYFFTPYLIIDNEVVTALILAAKRGVDVRIITPGIPDKKMIFLVTQSYYPQLVEGGVQIFQYRPGFVHAKCAVCDDKIATVGTINLDYRSLYLHFENGLFLYNNDTVMDIKKDILDTLEDCNRIMPEMCKKNMFFLLLQGILRIFAPLL
mgnify:CR=1 FL=1